ncbi:MAG: succinylglutamate desuccinylase/aspartoacylase family protein [Pseudomonadota bacterium]
MSDPIASIENTYPVKIMPPDLERYANGTEGVPFVHTFRANAPGPHVALAAIVHGNEPCGAIALDTFLREGVRPVRGTLSFVFVNISAHRAFDVANPNASRWVDEDFNRLWSPATLDGPRRSAELDRARELRPFMDTVDLLLDIHSMQHTAEPLMMAGPVPKGVALAKDIGVPETIVIDEGHAAGPRLRDYGAFIDPGSARNACLVECGQHWEAKAADVALDSALRFMKATGAIAPAVMGDVAGAPPQRVLRITERVTITSDAFAFTGQFTGMDVIADAGTVIAHDGDEPVRTPYDDCVLIMPSKRLWPGQTAVRLGQFVPA